MRLRAMWLSVLAAGVLILPAEIGAFADFQKPNQSNTEVTAYVGGKGGQFHSLLCPASTPILVGFAGRYGWWQDAIAPLCIAVNEVGRWRGQTPTEPRGSRVGGNGGESYVEACPAGTFVLGWLAWRTAQHPDYLVGMRIACGRPETGPVSQGWLPFDSERTDELDYSVEDVEVKCRAGSVGVGINVYAGSYVDRIALVCGAVFTGPDALASKPKNGLDASEQVAPVAPNGDGNPAGNYKLKGLDQPVAAVPDNGGEDPALQYGKQKNPAAPTTDVGGTPAPSDRPTSQTYKPPRLASGLRLYACQTLDSDVCKRPVADMFCQQQGFARADRYDTGKAKGPAETLGGETCTDKKCKVFDKIVCVR